MKVKLIVEDIMSLEEQDKAMEIQDMIVDILGCRPVGTISDYEGYLDE